LSDPLRRNVQPEFLSAVAENEAAVPRHRWRLGRRRRQRPTSRGDWHEPGSCVPGPQWMRFADCPPFTLSPALRAQALARRGCPRIAARRALAPGVDRLLADPLPLRHLGERIAVRLPHGSPLARKIQLAIVVEQVGAAGSAPR